MQALGIALDEGDNGGERSSDLDLFCRGGGHRVVHGRLDDLRQRHGYPLDLQLSGNDA